MIRFSPVLIAVAFLLATPVVHADKVAQYKKPQSFDVTDDFYAIEGAGLYQGADSRSLGLKMWDNSDRADITKLLIDMPVNSANPVVQEMIKAVLLSEASIKKLDDYDEINIGEDLLTLRMLKLMQGGYYKDAMALYSVAVETPHHQDIAKAGILAMLGTGEKSIACLEMKTLGNMNMSDPFWPSFMGYCNYTLSELPSESAQTLLEGTKYEIMRALAFNETFVFPYTADSFAKLSLLEKNTLVAEGKIEAPEITQETVRDIPAADIYALLSLEALNDEARALLTLEGVAWGVLPVDAINTLYEEHKDDEAVLDGLPHLYGQLKDTEDDEQAGVLLREALGKRGGYYDVALLPFVGLIGEGKLGKIAPEEMRIVLPSFYRLNRSLPADIIEKYLENSEEHIENPQYLQTLKLINLLNSLAKSHKIGEIMQNISIFHKSSQDDKEIVIENLDKAEADVDNAIKVYEKDVDAALQKEHTDGSEALQEMLLSKSRDNALGETVLLSIKLLHDKAIAGIGENTFEGSINALNNANLTDFSRKMAIERLIGDEENI